MSRYIALCLFVCIGSEAIAEDTRYRSPSQLLGSPDGTQLFVCESTAGSVALIELKKGTVVRRYACKGSPTGLALSADAKTLFVTVGLAQGRVLVFDTDSGELRRAFAVGHTPMAPVLSGDQNTLYVCNRFNNTVMVLDAKSGAVRNTVPVQREPVSAALTRDGSALLVVNHLPASPANGSYVAATVTVIDVASAQVRAQMQLPNGSNGLRDICLSPDGLYAYVPHVLARYQLPTTQLERGWINTNAISVFDLTTMKRLTSFLLDDIDQGAPNPWGIAITRDGRRLLVTHSGSHEISLIDRIALHARLKERPADRAPNDLSMLVGLRKRIALEGLGPRSCDMVGATCYVAQFFSDDIGLVDLSKPEAPVVSTLSLGPAVAMNRERRGRFLFNDGSFCFQKWQSCTSCHPSERMDALNWDILNDGIGNPKNTKSLLHSHKTPPTTVTGCRPDAETSVRAGIRFFMAILPEEDAVAIDDFLKSMKPVPSPYLVKGQLSDAAHRGKKVFKRAKCGKCHSGEYLTDLKRHDVGTGNGQEANTPFDVPTLIEIWRTAPYLHDGRALTIRDVVTTHNEDDDHGYTQDLSDHEISDLAQYVLSL